MKKQAISIILSLCFSIMLCAQEQFSTSIFFETANAELTDLSKKELDNLTTQLANYGDFSIEVKAHTDARGNDAYNLNLSNQRANSVIDYLSKLGIESSQSSATSFGESRPEYTNETEEGMRKNRRVDVLATVFSIENMDDLMARLSENNEQEYRFSPNESIKITALNGTNIWIPANAFVDKNGEIVTSEVTFHIKEAYSHLDMIANGLSTVSGEKLLETGGMVFMDAEADGEKLELRPDANLIVEMPTEQTEENMQLFTGNPTENGMVDWETTGQDFKSDEKDFLKFPPMPKLKFSRKTFPSYTCDEDTRPKTPKKPRKPVEPREPKREQFKFNPGFIKTLSLGKKGIKEEEEKRYQAALEKFVERHSKYTNISKPRYEEELIAF